MVFSHTNAKKESKQFITVEYITADECYRIYRILVHLLAFNRCLPISQLLVGHSLSFAFKRK